MQSARGDGFNPFLDASDPLCAALWQNIIIPAVRGSWMFCILCVSGLRIPECAHSTRQKVSLKFEFMVSVR